MGEEKAVIIHVENTTIVAPGRLREALQEGISHGKSVNQYIKEVESGKFLSEQGKKYFEEFLLYWDDNYDEKYAMKCFQATGVIELSKD